MPVKPIDWNVSTGLLTQSYRNLNQRKLMSLRQKINKSWLLIGHSADLVLRNVEFKISDLGRAQVLASGQRNVHAYAIGTLVGAKFDELPLMAEITYDPFNMSNFVWRDTGLPLYRADWFAAIDSRVYCSIESQTAQLTLFS